MFTTVYGVFATACGVCSTPGPNPCACCVEGFTVLAEHDLADVAGVMAGAVDRCLVLAAYDDGVGDLVAQLKYRAVRTAVPWIADAMAARVHHAGESPHVVTWVPASRRGRRRRGIDQGQVLARAVGRRLGVPARRLLDRHDTGNQTGRTRTDRLVGPHVVPRRRSAARGGPGTVLVIDDVVTTGASLAAAGRALRAAGAERIVAAALAHRCADAVGPSGARVGSKGSTQ